jgi:subtilisin
MGDQVITVGLLDTGVDPSRVAHARWASTSRRGRLVEDDHPRDRDGHGTAMAGAIAQRAPAAELHVAGVLHGGDVIARIVAGLTWLRRRESRVVCLPFGLVEPNPVLDQLIGELRSHDVLVVAAAGNDGAGRLREPARSADVVAVGASDPHGEPVKLSGSEFRPADGVRKPDLLCPSDRGTSLACATVAGLAARAWASAPGASAELVRHALLASCEEVPARRHHRSARGVIDGAALAGELRSARPPSAPEPARPRRYRDPRLERQLACAPPGADVAAVLVGTETRLVSEPASLLRARIERDDPVVASAADVDAWAEWSGHLPR